MCVAYYLGKDNYMYAVQDVHTILDTIPGCIIGICDLIFFYIFYSTYLWQSCNGRCKMEK